MWSVVVSGQDGRGKQQWDRGSRRQGGAGGERQGNGIVEAVQSQVILQGSAGMGCREIWLGVDLRRCCNTSRGVRAQVRWQLEAAGLVLV